MHRVVVWKHDERLQQVSMRKKVLTIGRGGDNDVTLEDKQVSKHHAEIRAGLFGVVVKDLDSSNGTRVNGVPFRGKQKLVPGDHIHIGPFNLHFDPKRAVGAVEEIAQRTDRVVVLECKSGPEKGLVYRDNLAKVSIGTGKDCDLTLPRDPAAAPRHAVIQLEGQRFFVRDHSGGQTFLNKFPVRHHEIADGDLLRFGQSIFTFRALDA